MQRPLDIYVLAAVTPTTNKLEIACDGSASVVWKVASSLVTDPSVRTTTTRIYPEDVLEAKIVVERSVNDPDSHCHEGPTFSADVRLSTASTDFIIVGQINVKNQLLCNRFESIRISQSFAVSGVSAVNRANFKTGRVQA
jgi:hypothetical protein